MATNPFPLLDLRQQLSPLQQHSPAHLLYQCLSMADRRSMVVWWCWGGMPISLDTSALAVRHMRPPVAGHSSRSKPPTSVTTAHTGCRREQAVLSALLLLHVVHAGHAQIDRTWCCSPVSSQQGQVGASPTSGHQHFAKVHTCSSSSTELGKELPHIHPSKTWTSSSSKPLKSLCRAHLVVCWAPAGT
jgi:hypothetical protein